MKRIITILLCLCLCVGLVPTVGAAAVVEVDSVAEFAAIGANLAGSYKLTGDITFTPADFAEGGAMYGKLPFGKFTGTLDGDGHTLYGLTVDAFYTHAMQNDEEQEKGDNIAGVFKTLSGTVQNLALKRYTLRYALRNPENAGGIVQNHIGGIAGKMETGGKIVGCMVEGTLAVTMQDSASGLAARLDFGGIAGINAAGTVSDSAFYGDISVARDSNIWSKVAGIVGNNDETDSTVSGCYADIDIDLGETPMSNVVGGSVVCRNDGTVKDSYATGTPIVGEPGKHAGVPGVETDCAVVIDSFLAENYPKFDFATRWTIENVNDANQPILSAFVCVHQAGEMLPVSAPTCAVPGLKEQRCTKCGTLLDSELIDATGLHTAGAMLPVQNATCAVAGLKEQRCTVCSALLDSEPIPATGAHKWDSGKVTVKPTYAKKGEKLFTCTTCPAGNKATKTEPVAKLKGENTLKIFKDIKKGDWFVKNGSIDFVYNMGLFKGATATTFEPNSPMTRAMFVTVLGRLHGVEVNNKAKTPFTDVKKNQYYTGYVKWANDNGIVTGSTETTFSPDANVTREQICAMMVRYCSFAKIKLAKKNAAITFKDAKRISSYARSAVKACQRGGVVNGEKKTDGYYFRPQGNATRAEVATIVMNFYNNYMK